MNELCVSSINLGGKFFSRWKTFGMGTACSEMTVQRCICDRNYEPFGGW